MYVSESVWYQREIRRKAFFKRSIIYFVTGSFCLLLVAVFFNLPWNRLFWAEDKEEVSKFLIQEEKEIAEDSEPEMGEVTENIIKPEEVVVEKTDENESNTTPIIILDPGHGGMDEGCSRGEIEEKDINLKLALSLKDKLEEKGFLVYITRESDVEMSLTDRAAFAQHMQGDILISIHQNACEYEEVAGIETWYDKSTGENSKRLAGLIQKYLISNTEAEDRGILETDTLYVIRESGMPACLVETGFLSNEEESELIAMEEYCDKIVQGLADAVWYYFYPKKMYLTFDDGPSKENTEIILDILKERNIQATFFVVGENVKKYPEVIKRISEEGHVIGIHCYNHSYDKIYASVDDYIKDFEQAKELVFEITGKEVWCYRFPGGSINKYNKYIYMDIVEKMSESGYVYYDWNGCFEDAVSNPTQEHIVKSAVESTLKRKKVIMLAHDTVKETALCLNEVLDLLPEYEFLPLSTEVEPVQFK